MAVTFNRRIVQDFDEKQGDEYLEINVFYDGLTITNNDGVEINVGEEALRLIIEHLHID